MTHQFSSLSPMVAPAGLSTRKDRRHDRLGVLLVNLGTPDGTGYWAVRRYLSEFLTGG
jgi:ferrochelatase